MSVYCRKNRSNTENDDDRDALVCGLDCPHTPCWIDPLLGCVQCGQRCRNDCHQQISKSREGRTIKGMREIVTEGSTVDDAVKIALEKLQVSHDQVEIDVLESGSRGFLGLIGGKQAKVRVTVKESPKEIITKFISDVIKALEFDADFNIYYQDGYWRVDFEGEDVRFLIGRKGKTLNSLQMLANLSVNNKLEEKVKIIIDAEGYRERREESLRRLARKTAERVCRTKKDICLSR